MIDKVLDDQYDLRVRDKKAGIPTRETLNKMGLDNIVTDLIRLGLLPD